MKSLTQEQWFEILNTEAYKENRQEYMDRMTKEGFKIILPAPNELFLDIDSEEAYEIFLERFTRVKNSYPFENATYEVLPSKSGLPHRHVIISLRDLCLEPIQRIAIQAILNSDPVREMLSLLRYFKGDLYPTLLAQKK